MSYRGNVRVLRGQRLNIRLAFAFWRDGCRRQSGRELTDGRRMECRYSTEITAGPRAAAAGPGFAAMFLTCRVIRGRARDPSFPYNASAPAYDRSSCGLDRKPATQSASSLLGSGSPVIDREPYEHENQPSAAVFSREASARANLGNPHASTKRKECDLCSGQIVNVWNSRCQTHRSSALCRSSWAGLLPTRMCQELLENPDRETWVW